MAHDSKPCLTVTPTQYLLPGGNLEGSFANLELAYCPDPSDKAQAAARVKSGAAPRVLR